MLNNLGSTFKIYLIIVNNFIQKNKQLGEDNVLFKAIKEKKTCIKAEHKAYANFATTKSNAKSQKATQKRKKKFVERPKYRKYGWKHLVGQTYKHAKKKCDKCCKKEHFSRFYDSYIFLNKEKILQKPGTISRPDFKKNVSCVTQIIANKIFEIGIIWKIIADLDIT